MIPSLSIDIEIRRLLLAHPNSTIHKDQAVMQSIKQNQYFSLTVTTVLTKPSLATDIRYSVF